MKNMTKAIMGTAAAAAMAVSANPALAKHGDRDDGISTSEVIAGVAILGGIAAILSSNDNDRYDRDYHRGGRDGFYRGRGYDGERAAINRCIRTVERGNRYGYAKVTDIRDIDRTRYGYAVKGRLTVNSGYRDRYDRYGRGGYRNYDSGKFTCYVERGRVVDIDYRGIRGY
ncbi:hypothetical protein ACFOWX_01335 [Sphingorhabdus arenilitoris]|uniref:17 kDa surface antigen n=1 Tax=Sphingorhabdus arenilitoris TaxID=1490041 RepID=A0ABV8RCI2_9SPHN